MNLASQVFALIAALTHLVVGTLERFFYDRTAVRVFLTTSPAAPEVTLWRSGVAVYNPLLGLGPVAGVVALHTGEPTAGRTPGVPPALALPAAALL